MLSKIIKIQQGAGSVLAFTIRYYFQFAIVPILVNLVKILELLVSLSTTSPGINPRRIGIWRSLAGQVYHEIHLRSSENPTLAMSESPNSSTHTLLTNIIVIVNTV